MDEHSEIETFTQWQKDRQDAVTAPTGNVAMVDFQPVGEHWAEVAHLPIRVRRIGDAEGIEVSIADGAEVTIDGESVTGEVFLGRLTSAGTPMIASGSVAADAFTLDGTEYKLRFYDAEADALDRFEKIETYPYNPDAVWRGELRPYPETAEVPWSFTRERDTGHKKQVPGLIAVSIEGREYELITFLNGEDMVLVYADGGTGSESYAPGKFLVMPPPAAGATEVLVDFNYSFIPPCGFSDFYSCPIPPPENRIEATVRAGEKQVRWREEK